MENILKMIEISQKLNSDLMELYFDAESLIKLTVEETENTKLKMFLEQELKRLDIKLDESMKDLRKVNDNYKTKMN